MLLECNEFSNRPTSHHQPIQIININIKKMFTFAVTFCIFMFIYKRNTKKSKNILKKCQAKHMHSSFYNNIKRAVTYTHDEKAFFMVSFNATV